MWTSASGGGRISTAGLALALGATSAAAAAVFLVLPAAGRLVARLLHRPGRRRRLHRRPRWPGRRFGGCRAALPGRQSRQPDPRRRLSRLRRQPEHGAAGNLGNPLVMQVRAQRPSYWVGETFDPWQGQSWSESQPVPRRPSAQSSPFILPISAGRSALRAERPADVLRLERHGQPRLPRRERRTSCGSPPASSTSPATAPSSRPSAWAPGPSTRSIRRSAPPRPAQLRADGTPFSSPRPRCAGGAVAPPLPPGAGAGPVRHRRTTPTPTTRCSPSSTGSAPTPATRRTSRPCPPAPTRSTSSSSATGSASASRSRPRWP